MEESSWPGEKREVGGALSHSVQRPTCLDVFLSSRRASNESHAFPPKLCMRPLALPPAALAPPPLYQAGRHAPGEAIQPALQPAEPNLLIVNSSI